MNAAPEHESARAGGEPGRAQEQSFNSSERKYTPPAPDRDAILATLDTLFRHDDIIELRAFPKGRKRTDAGYFDADHREQLADAALRLNRAGAAVYVPLNPIDPQLLGRYCNRVESYATATATDANVTWRRLFLIDFDPVRPKDTSATDAQLEAAKAAARACHRALKAEGWPDPIVCESGNGIHLLYPIDLPNDDASRDLVKNALAGLAERFDTVTVTVDRSVFNAGRITKLYGTVATKGDSTEATRWRLSRMIKTPERTAVVTVEQLRAVAPASTGQEERTPGSGRNGSAFDFDGFMARLGIEFEQDMHDGRERYKLEHCPFNKDHGKGDAAIFRNAAGVLGFRCVHNGCARNTWQTLRTLVDGPQQTRRERPEGAEEADFEGVAWPDPEPLPTDLPPVQPFDLAMLPAAFRPWIGDIAERMQCPRDYPAVGAMVTLASVVGRQLGIRPKRRDDWTVVPNVWGDVIGRPSLLKTPAMQEPIHMVEALEANAREEHEAAEREHAAEAMVTEARVKDAKARIAKAVKDRDSALAHALALEAAGDSNPPVRRRYLTQDPTVEKLGELLRDNPRGILVYRDELVGFLRSLDREGREGSRAFYLEAWNGTSRFTYDRIGRGTVEIEAACVSILGAIQPGPLGDYMVSAIRGGMGDDGLVQRLQLAVWPDAPGTWRNVDRWPDTDARRAAREVYERLDRIDAAAMGATQEEGDPLPWVRFAADAQDEFDAWRAALETRLRAGDLHPALEAHLAKYRSLVPSIALLCHLADNPEGGPVGHRSLLRALAWSEYLESHARRIYAPALDPDMAGAVELSRHLADLPDPFTARDVYRAHWRYLDRDGTAGALAVLVDYGHIRPEESAGPGRPTVRFRMHPALCARGTT